MPLSEERLAALTRGCNPYQWLAPNDPRNVAIDRMGGRDDSPRGGGWAATLSRRLTRAANAIDGDVLCFFSGLPGSGKTTELRRLAELLAGDGWLPVIVDAEQYIDLNQSIDLPDVLFPVLYEVECAVRGVYGGAWSDQAASWLAALDRWFRDFGVELIGAPEGASWDARAVASLRDRPPIQQQVRDAVAARPALFHAQVVDQLARLQQLARAAPASRRGVVVLFDSLEHLRGTPTSWTAVLSSAEALFVHNREWLRLFLPTLYTVPPQLVLHAQLTVDFMPMVKLHQPGAPGRLAAPGYDALRALVERRIPIDDLRSLFDDVDEAEARRRVDEIVRQSGGYPRVLVQILYELLIAADPAVSEAAFTRCLDRLADRARDTVSFRAESIPWLARVAHRHELKAADEAERAVAVHMVQYNVVLMYLNGRSWWDVHPWIREMPEINAQVAAMERGGQ